MVAQFAEFCLTTPLFILPRMLIGNSFKQISNTQSHCVAEYETNLVRFCRENQDHITLAHAPLKIREKINLIPIIFIAPYQCAVISEFRLIIKHIEK